MIKLAPSILSANFSDLKTDIEHVEKAGAKYLHIDVMDGVFVPNITVGPPVINCLRQISQMVFDVHLMIVEPEKHFEAFVKAGADIITIHAEACRNLEEAVKAIKSLGVKAGVTIKPKTDLNVIMPVINYIDLALVMTVEPGFGGQSLIKGTLDKVVKLREIIRSSGLKVDLEVDGGIHLDNIKTVLNSGADVIVVGSGVFNENSIEGNIKDFLAAFKEYEKSC